MGGPLFALSRDWMNRSMRPHHKDRAMPTLIHPRRRIKPRRRPENPTVLKAKAALNQHAYGCLRDINVIEHDEQLVLQGDVDSFYLKQMAQETVLRIDPAATVSNQIAVS